MFVTNWISTTKIQKISEITNFFRHYFLSRTEVVSIFKCFSWGGMSVLLPMYSYWNLVAWDFLPALLCAIPFILLTLLISCILVVRKIQFII